MCRYKVSQIFTTKYILSIESLNRGTYETVFRDIPITNSRPNLVYTCCPGWTMINSRSHGCNKREFLIFIIIQTIQNRKKRANNNNEFFVTK